ncbi:ATP-binding cassette domain-containing protein, partial [Thermotoga sp.]|uniref:ATP-binding cassette domain-containing protein n=1 Tax=Thermotoga sp. TaxID=28240 RepID=UPI0025CE4305
MEAVLEMKNITKVFPGVLALDNVNLRLEKGEVKALVGENGAGKSTLIKVLTGAYTPDSGEIKIFGQTFHKMTPILSERLGISAVYQNLILAGHLTVLENVLMGIETSFAGFLRKREMEKRVEEILEKIGYKGVIWPYQRVKDLSAAQQGMVAIARALSRNARIFIFDEPTAVLAEKEVKELFRVIRQLKDEGMSVIYISHRLEEIFELCDNVLVLKDGRVVGEKSVKETTEDELIRMMVGREVRKDLYDPNREIG